jgi:hypothetical protein
MDPTGRLGERLTTSTYPEQNVQTMPSIQATELAHCSDAVLDKQVTARRQR